MAVFYKDLSRIIRLDEKISKIPSPELILKTRDFRVLGGISNYTNWNVSIQGNSIDEISFDVAKYVDGKLNPIWDDLIDLRVVELKRYGCFEIEVTYTDNTKTVKSINGYSLERELGQLYLHDFHVNDDDAKTMIITEYNAQDFDKDGNFINTTFYNPEDEKHSLLHRILAEKAPHWSLGDITPYIAPAEDKVVESSSTFVREFTADGTSVYDFLTQDIANECNVVFLFDTLHRQINCYSVINGLDKDGNVKQIEYGEDTNVYISKENLANEITLSPDVDNVKNCFRIEGGDDIINADVRTVNVSGSNYIYNFNNFQAKDMPSGLYQKLKDYQQFLEDKSKGYEDLMLQLQDAYEKQSDLRSVMSPAGSMKEDIEGWVKKTAKEQFEDIRLKLINGKIGVDKIANATTNRVNNNIESMAQVYSDSRFTVEVVMDTDISTYNSSTKTWTGLIVVKRITDETVYPPSKDVYKDYKFSVQVVDDDYNLTYTQQKLQISLTECDIFDIDTDISTMTDSEMKAYFLKYSLNRLYSFKDAYNTAVSILQQALVEPDMSEPVSTKVKEFYNKYVNIKNIVENCYSIREKECKEQDSLVTSLEGQCATYRKNCDMRTYLGEEYYKDLFKYIREDTYENSNYISDNLTNAEAMENAKKLVEAAKKELEKACVVQRKVSITLSNLFALPEFESLYDSFQLYNYIRVRTEDELLKLRILGLEISGDSLNSVTVTFADKIESITGSASDIKSILDQAQSISTTYNSTVKQAEKGSKANDYVTDLRNNGLSSAMTMIKNDNSETFTITPGGAIAKRMDDVGFYGDKQLKILGNGIYFTKDNWQTICQAIGEFLYTDADGNKTLDYGIIAKYIVGELIAGNQLVITAGNGNVTIDENGITLANGQCITYKQDAPMSEVTLEYMNSNSSTVAPSASDSGWSSTCPEWEADKYIWQKITTVDANGETKVSIVCISGRNGQDGEKGEKGDKGEQGLKGDTGLSGKDGNNANVFYLESSVESIEKKMTYKNASTVSSCMFPSIIYFKSYVQEGNEVQRNDYSARYMFEESIDGTTWTTRLTTEATAHNYNTYNDGKGYAYTISSVNTNYIRCTMLATGTLIKLRQTVIPVIVTDVVNSTKKQYYISSSSSSVTDGSWTDTVPTYIGSKYLWSRTFITYESGYTYASNAQYESDLTTRLKDMTDFQTDTKNKINALSPTKIGDDYVFSPKIGGGYAYFTNGTYSIEIDPNGQAANTDKNYLFCIRNGSSCIMGVDTSGNGEFKGNIEAKQLDLYKDSTKYGQFDMGYNPYNNSNYYGLGIVANGVGSINNDNSHRRISFGIYRSGTPSNPVPYVSVTENIYFTKSATSSDSNNWNAIHDFGLTDVKISTLNGEAYDSGWKPVSSYGSGISAYSGSSLYMRRVGKMVYLRGVLTNSSSITTSEGNKKTLFTIDSQFRPLYPHQSIQQGSGSNRWLMEISTDGIVTLDRYSNNTAIRNTVSTGAWLICTTSWMVN